MARRFDRLSLLMNGGLHKCNHQQLPLSDHDQLDQVAGRIMKVSPSFQENWNRDTRIGINSEFSSKLIHRQWMDNGMENHKRTQM